MDFAFCGKPVVMNKVNTLRRRVRCEMQQRGTSDMVEKQSIKCLC